MQQGGWQVQSRAAAGDLAGAEQSSSRGLRRCRAEQQQGTWQVQSRAAAGDLAGAEQSSSRGLGRCRAEQQQGTWQVQSRAAAGDLAGAEQSSSRGLGRCRAEQQQGTWQVQSRAAAGDLAGAEQSSSRGLGRCRAEQQQGTAAGCRPECLHGPLYLPCLPGGPHRTKLQPCLTCVGTAGKNGCVVGGAAAAAAVQVVQVERLWARSTRVGAWVGGWGRRAGVRAGRKGGCREGLARQETAGEVVTEAPARATQPPVCPTALPPPPASPLLRSLSPSSNSHMPGLAACRQERRGGSSAAWPR